MNEKSTPMPALSTDLGGPRVLDRCQACEVYGGIDGTLDRWQECDDCDYPTSTIVILCKPCAGQLIEPHPRLYQPVPKNKPLVGAMECCATCIHSLSGLRCGCPDSLANGGGGMKVTFAQPMSMFVDGMDQRGRRTGGRIVRYGFPPQCEGWAAREATADALNA